MKNSKKDKLKKEIEEKKKQLREEFDMLEMSGEDNLPPELELEWLTSILEFEKQAKQQKRITVYDKIERPEIKPADELTPSELTKELNFVMDLLLLNGLQLNVIHDVADEDLYRFIIEELYKEEIDDINVPGYRLNFIYEEFHPNHYEDIKSNTIDAIESILSTKDKFWEYKLDLSNFVSTDGTLLTEERVKNKIAAFKEAFSDFDIREIEIEKVDYDLDKKEGSTVFYLDYVVVSVDTGEEMRFSGEGSFHFIYKYDAWSINTIDMQGFRI